jgi:hypothetical protein
MMVEEYVLDLYRGCIDHGFWVVIWDLVERNFGFQKHIESCLKFFANDQGPKIVGMNLRPKNIKEL